MKCFSVPAVKVYRKNPVLFLPLKVRIPVYGRVVLLDTSLPVLNSASSSEETSSVAATLSSSANGSLVTRVARAGMCVGGRLYATH